MRPPFPEAMPSALAGTDVESLPESPDAGGYASDSSTALLLKLEEGQGDVVRDSGPYGNVGFLRGGEWTRGRYGGGLLLDGIDDHIQVPYSPSLAIAAKLTLEAWLFPLGEADGVGALIARPNAYVLEVLEGSDMRFRGGIWRGGMPLKVTSSSMLERRVWQHLAMTFDGSTLRLYLGGVLDAQLPVGSGGIDAGSSDLFVGAHPVGGTPTRALAGIVDELRVSSVARWPVLDPPVIEMVA